MKPPITPRDAPVTIARRGKDTQLQRTVHAVIRPGEQSGYVAECPALHAVTQGSTLDEIAANLREVLTLALEGEDLEQLGFAPAPVIIATLELDV